MKIRFAVTLAFIGLLNINIHVPLLARIVSLCGDHCTLNISSLWDSKLWSFILRFLMSHIATVLSAEPVARIYSE